MDRFPFFRKNAQKASLRNPGRVILHFFSAHQMLLRMTSIIRHHLLSFTNHLSCADLESVNNSVFLVNPNQLSGCCLSQTEMHARVIENYHYESVVDSRALYFIAGIFVNSMLYAFAIIVWIISAPI